MKRLGIIFTAGIKYLKGTKSLRQKIKYKVTMKHNYLYMPYIKFQTLKS